MKISLHWLADLVSWDDTPADLAARLTDAGLNVERIEEINWSWPGVVVAEVLDCRKHPDADRLTVCRVTTGDGDPATIVCGAPNVRPGLRVLLASPGTVLPGGLTIKPARIRGVESLGMLCSETELGLGRDSSGIMEIEDDAPAGTPVDDLFGYRDTVLDIEVTPNRPDWLSHMGIAREVAAIYGTKLNPPTVIKPSSGGRLGWKVEIESFADCPRYTAHGATGIRIGPSPRWMQNRLRAVGQRPINNVVDITNYVLFELGHPLHAFDHDRISGGVITVRRARRKQSITTLDEVSRQIQGDDLIIADGDGPIALAGVMGLASSEVHEGTTSLLLESAFFAPALVRNCSRRLGLISESSYRFEREADWAMVKFAAQRALYLMQEHCGADVIGESVDRYDPDYHPDPDLPLRVHQVNRVLGTELDMEQAADYLQSLGLKVQPLSSQIEPKTVNLMIQVPTFRRDLKQEIDLVEEIARRCGFDKGDHAASAPPMQRRTRARRDEIPRLLRFWLASLGYHEIVTTSFMAREHLDAIGFHEDDPRRHCMRVLNPHHGREALLRTSLIPSFACAARHNVHAGARLPIRLFQIGRLFWPDGKKLPDKGPARNSLLPEEPCLLQCGLSGSGTEGLGAMPTDVLEIKGITEQLPALLQLNLSLVPEDSEPYLASGLQWRIVDSRANPVGALGRLASNVAAAMDLDQPFTLLELRLDLLQEPPRTVGFKEFHRYPAARRDLSLLVPQGVSFAQIEDSIRNTAGELLAGLELFDFYTGRGCPSGMAAYGIRLKFHSSQGSLTTDTIEQTVTDCLTALQAQWQVIQRTS